MTATTEDRNTHYKDGEELPFPVSAGEICLAGTLAVLNGGFAEGGTTAVGLIAQGRFEETVDNSAGADGDLIVRIRRKKAFLFANSAAADEIAQADVGADCYIVDNQTVAKTDGAASRSVAGEVVGIETNGVWVEFK